ncbi:MAG: EamA family transporter [Actinobacteria bacterium]|nr:EamA family transporter [Actinomycetota bacterium]
MSGPPGASGAAVAPGGDGGIGAAPLLVLGAILSVQIGAATATTLFDEIGPAGTVLFRLLFAALLLWAIWRPSLRGHPREALSDAALFGVTLAGMNICFYMALDRIPLGIAVTLEFVGPLAVALLASRRRLDLVWVGLAATGILLLAGPASSLDALGVVLALTAGGFWGIYILLAARVGRAFSGGRGLALAMVVAAALMVVPGVAAAGESLLSWHAVAVGAAVALLSSVIPYSLELESLRRLPVGVFGVLMSLEPAVAAAVGLVGLEQGLSATEAAGIALVVAASVGVLRRPGAAAPTEA